MKSITAILNFTAAGILSLFLLLQLVYIYMDKATDKDISHAVIGGADSPTVIFTSKLCIPIVVFIILLITLLLYNAVYMKKK